ncbi:MAG: type II CAAX endopeptidase family protein [Pyrinomonadaceae bacterium]
MPAYNLFTNKAGRLRSGWRLGIFVVTFSIISALLGFGLVLMLAFGFGFEADRALGGFAGHVAQTFILFTAAGVAGWACGAIIEDLPWRALGWAIHKGWLRDFLLGSVIGAVSLTLAVLLGTIGGGFHFTFNSSAATAIARTLIFSGLLFVFAAAAEEVLFRGYPLQTLTRARLVWLGILITSVPFALAHLKNPNVIRGVTFANTVLAGVWLAVAYLRTRSLWLPLGIHWAWNWTMAAVLGLPVSGITRLTPSPLLKTLEAGPTWLTGGAYGPEGGVACTAALVVSIVFVWFAPWFSATTEMKKFTDDENPTRKEMSENALRH